MKASQELIDEVEQMKVKQQQLTERLKSQVAGNHDNELLIEKNNEIHQEQYHYLLKRYLLNVERKMILVCANLEKLMKCSIQWVDYKKEFGIHYK